MIDVEIRNAQKLADNIENLQVRKWITKSLQQALLVLEREVKMVTPVDTGLLRNSYETMVRQFRLDAVLNNYREYAPIVEARQRFLEEGVRNSENRIQDIFVKNIEDLLVNI